MTPDARERLLDASGAPIRVLEWGAGPTTVLCLHGGLPGYGPLPLSADVWEGLAGALASDCHVVAPDLPGAGGSVPRTLEELTPQGASERVAEVIRGLDLGHCHIVAHDEAALVAFALLLREHDDIGARSLALLAPAVLAPTGSRSENITLLNEPMPRWSRRSLLWTVRRLAAYEPAVDSRLLRRLEANAASDGHARAVALLDAAAAGHYQRALYTSTGAWLARCNEGAFGVPMALIWGMQDGLSSLERVLVAYSLLGRGSAEVGLHVLNRCGHFPFDEQPAATAAIVRGLITRSEADALVTSS